MSLLGHDVQRIMRIIGRDASLRSSLTPMRELFELPTAFEAAEPSPIVHGWHRGC